MNKDFDIWMIRMKGDSTSEIYAKYCSKSWIDAGFEVNFFDAVTPSTLHNYIHKLKFDDKAEILLNDQEKSCLLSQFLLWEKCRDTDRPILVLEHDAYLKTPDMIKYNSDFDVTFFGQHCMEATLFTPSYIGDFLDWIKKLERIGGISNGPYSLHVIYTGMHHRFGGRPYASYLGPGSPVRDIIIKELGSVIVHPDKGRTSDNLFGNNKNPFKIVKLKNVLNEIYH